VLVAVELWSDTVCAACLAEELLFPKNKNGDKDGNKDMTKKCKEKSKQLSN
jgi:hypothetical protein